METRTYPTCCTSQFCGCYDCEENKPDCPNLPTLREFKEWRDRTKAEKKDPIWSPRFWTATVER